MFLDRRIGLARLKMGINASVSLFFQPKSPPTLNLLKYFSHLWNFILLIGSNNIWWSWNFNVGLILVNSFMFWKWNVYLPLNLTSKKIFYFYLKSNSFIIFADFFYYFMAYFIQIWFKFRLIFLLSKIIIHCAMSISTFIFVHPYPSLFNTYFCGKILRAIKTDIKRYDKKEEKYLFIKNDFDKK